MVLKFYKSKNKIIIFFILAVILTSCNDNIKNNYIKTKKRKLYQINYSSYIEKLSKDDVIISFADYPNNLNPYRANKPIEFFFKTALFSSLFYIDPKTLELKRNIVENYSVSNDGLTHYFSLKPNVRFNNGDLLESKDVLASLALLETVLKGTSLYKSFYINNEKLNFINISPLQFAITMDKPNINILYALADYPIIPEDVANKIKGNLDEFINLWNAGERQIVGSGPYILESYNDEKAILVKNPYYFKIDDKKNKLPYTSRIIIKFYKNKNKQIIEFINKASDIISLMDEDFKNLYEYYSLNTKENIKFIDTGYDLKKCLLVYNCFSDKSKTFLSDVKMRKYLSEAIHFKLLKKKFKGIDLSFTNTSDVSEYKKELFIDINNDGIMEYKDGNSVLVRIIAPEEEIKIVQVAKAAYEALKKINIDVFIEIVPYHVFLERLFYTKNYDIAFFYYNFYPGVIPYYNLLKNGNLNFYPVIKDSDKSYEIIENLLNDSITVNSIENQMNKINKIEKYLKDSYQLYPIFQEKNYFLIRDDIYNFKQNSSIEDYINLRTIETIIKNPEH